MHRLLLALALFAAHATAAMPLSVQTVAEGLEHPWSLAFLPDGRMLVTERVGRLRLLDAAGRLDPQPIAGVPEVRFAGQGGLLEVHVDADFADNQRLFLSYAAEGPDGRGTHLASACLQGHALVDVAVLFAARTGQRTDAHFGGRIARLPDGSLVMGLGDGFDYRQNAQSLANHHGSLVRVMPDGSVPADNPFLARDGALPEIYSLGHRNVQGVAWDAGRGVLWSHEHGPRGGDELNRIVPGGNYGWPVATHGRDYSGARVSPWQAREGMVDPLHVWTPSIAPAGLAVVEGPLFADWQGDLLVTALAGKALHRLRIEGEAVVEEEVLLRELDTRLRDVRIGPDGAIWLLTDGPQGRLLRVTPTAGPAPL